MTYLAELEEVAQSQPQLKHLKLIAFDVDGVLTDGTLHYTESGESLKVFHVRDGVGLKLLSDMGIEVVVITAKSSAMVAKRVNELGIQNYFPGTKDKLAVLEQACERFGFALTDCGFVGDDMVDAVPMKAAGVSMAPSDAYALVTEQADIPLPVKGGQGVARWVCDLILVAQGRYEEAYALTSKPAFERKR
jgi:3-deoxy-D-manno-octulosonate 8-phosphate phosphatase (KDO 8-P phosphatase)